MEYTKIKLRRDIQINWNRVNPVLESGEIGIITDINKFKIGDGITSFVLLPFATYNADELDSKFQNIQTQIDEIGGAELKERISAVEGKVEQNTNDITAIKGAGYLNSEQVNAIINGKDYATNTRVNEVENKIPSDTVTSAELQAVEDIANSKTTLEEVNQQGFAKDNELASVAKTGSYNDLSDKPTIPEGVVVDKELNINSDNAISNKAVTTKINSMDSEIASKTTIGEVEAKGYQDSTQVEQAINAKGYTTLDEVAQQGYAKGTIPTNNNQLENGADYQTGAQVEQTITSKNYTTISEVEGKGYQNSEQVEVAINAKEYVPKSQFATINSQSITDGGDIVIQGGGGGASIEVDKKLEFNSTNPVENNDVSYNINNIEKVIPNTTEEWVFTMDDGSTIKKDLFIQPTKSFYIENNGVENNITLFKFQESVDRNLEYSLDNGSTWTTWADAYNTPIVLAPYQKVFFRGTNEQMYGTRFSTTERYNIGGDITYLLQPNGMEDIWNTNRAFYGLFRETKVVDAKKLVLAKNTGNYCYAYLFSGCSELDYPPQFSIGRNTLIASNACEGMFISCNNLRYIPYIPFDSAYYNGLTNMFSNCQNFNNGVIIELYNMEQNCDGVLNYMLFNCSSCNRIEIRNLTRWKKENAQGWADMVSPTGVFIKPKELQVGDGDGQIPMGANGIPEGWTIIDK